MLEDKLSRVIDKIAGAAETQQTEAIPDSPVKTFTKFVASEMRKMTEDEQDEIKWSFMSSLRSIRRASLSD